MKLSFSTLGCPSWTLPRILETAGREGYDGIELRFIEDDDALWQRPELVGSGLNETLARLRDAGLCISCVDTRSSFHYPDATERTRSREEAARSLDLAARLGARGIRVFGDRVQPGTDLETTRGWIADSLAALWEDARRGGIEVWIETHGDFVRARDTISLLERAGVPGPSVIWDPANAYELGEDPEQGLRALSGRIGHVHLKDVRLPHQPVLLGDGDFPAARVLSLLQADGYDRWVSFEWEKKWHPEIEAAEIALPHFIRWASRKLRPRARVEAPPREHPRMLECGRMSVQVHRNRSDVGRAAADIVGAELRELVARDGRAAIIFASAPSQNEFLMALRTDASIRWDRLTAFHLDEYVGVGADHRASFRRFLKDRLFDHVPIRAFDGLDGRAQDLAAECGRYAARLREERPGLVVLGIGENGHIAFIDPPTCDFDDAADVRVVDLDEVCRNQQVHDGAFARIQDVPTTALSLTVPYLMTVPRAVAVVPGSAKREAVRAALEGPVTTACPASILRRHPDATLFLDEDSAARLERHGASMKASRP
jgi:glucosamine-6-phosphate deaminase